MSFGQMYPFRERLFFILNDCAVNSFHAAQSKLLILVDYHLIWTSSCDQTRLRISWRCTLTLKLKRTSSVIHSSLVTTETCWAIQTENAKSLWNHIFSGPQTGKCCCFSRKSHRSWENVQNSFKLGSMENLLQSLRVIYWSYLNFIPSISGHIYQNYLGICGLITNDMQMYIPSLWNVTGEFNEVQPRQAAK